MIKKFLSNLIILSKTFYRIPFLVPYWKSEEIKIIFKAIFSGRIIKGKEEEKFIKEFLNFIGSKYGFATNMGRSALELGLKGLGLGVGDEVIIPTFCCRGVITPVIRSGCTPVFADINNDFNISPESIKQNITPKTKAIIVVHLSGKAAKISEIKEIIKDKNIFLIEDVCQATGGKREGKFLGILGDVGIFAFGIGKNMMATAGGMLVTNLEEVNNRAQNIEIENERSWEVFKRVIHRIIKFRLRKYTAPFFTVKEAIFSKIYSLIPPDEYKLLKMSNLDAVMLSPQLDKLNEIIEKRRRNANILCRELSRLEDIIIPDFDKEHVFTKFIIIFKKGINPQKAELCQEVNNFGRYLMKNSIELEATYTPLHLREEFKKYKKINLPVSEDLFWRSITLPVQPNLREKDMLYMCNVIKKYFTLKIYG